MGSCVESQSCRACGVNWENQLSLPASASTASTGQESKRRPARASRQADNQFVLDHQRCAWRSVTARLGVIVHLGLPDFVSGARIHGHDVHIQRVHEERVAQNCNSAIYPAAAIESTRRIAVLV